MSNITRLPSLDVIRKEAEAWIIKLDGEDKPSRENLCELREWLARSPAHRKELQSVNVFWGNNALTELAVPRSREPKAFRTPERRWVMGAVAGVVVLVSALLLYLPQAIDSTNGVYVTAVGQQKTIPLVDGSIVELNTNSQIKVDYGEGYRNIRLLQGEVHFSVAKNSAKPFRVYAGDSRVQAIGTAFTIHVSQRSVNILVTEGVVGLASLSSQPTDTQLFNSSVDYNVAPSTNNSGATKEGNVIPVDSLSQSFEADLGILKEKQSITLRADVAAQGLPLQIAEAIETVSTQEIIRRQSWREGFLEFVGEPLEQVIHEISRYTTTSIEIVDPKVKAIQVGGRFQVGDVDELLSALEANFDLKVDRLGYNRVRLSVQL